jgi:uncharacterized protein (DUF2062 family)
MVFRSRHPPTLGKRVRGLLWPAAGWRRASRYIMLRVKRLPGTPHSIAAGLASGAALSMTPFMGFHFILSFMLSFLVRGNYIAAAIGTTVGNPWTFPFIWTGTYRLGSFMLGNRAGSLPPFEHLSIGALLHRIELLLWPMTLGSLPLAVIVWIGTYLVTQRFVAAFQHARRTRRARRRHAAARSPMVPD